jgi:hypothetical protein
MKLARNATAVVLAVAGAGCGFVFSEGPPADYQHRLYFDCGESVAPAVADAVAAAAAAVAVFAIASETGTDPAVTRAEKATAISVYTGFAGLLTTSLVYGSRASAACRAAKKERMADWARARPLTAPY